MVLHGWTNVTIFVGLMLLFLKNVRFSTQPVLLQLVVVACPRMILLIVGPYWESVRFELCSLWPLSCQKMFSAKSLSLLVRDGEIVEPRTRARLFYILL